MIRPISDESKLAHVDSMKWEDLKAEFRKQTTSLVSTIKKKLKVKMVHGKTLNASMLLSLTLEYVEAINAKETPTVLTAIDRVIQAESSKIQDELYDSFCQNLEEQLNDESFPVTQEVIKKYLKKTLKQHKLQLHKLLAQILNFSEIIKEGKRFTERVQDVMNKKLQQNYSASYHFSVGVLRKIYETLQNPFQNLPKGTNVDSVVIHDYIRKWVLAFKEYKELAKCTSQWETLAESIVK